jgi:hypothetical protein
MLAFALVGCGLTLVKDPTPTRQILITTPIFTSTSSITPKPLITIDQQHLTTVTPTTTVTPINTLEPDKAIEEITTLMRNPVDCSAPCFWGITPGQTKIGEARNIFSHYGLQMASKTYDGKGFHSIHYVLDSILSNWVTLTTQNNIVENIRIQITIERQNSETSRYWLAYSPETLIKRYGPPSRVDIVADWGPGPFFAMQMYFDDFDLIVQYSGDNIIPNQKSSSQVCPKTDQFENVWLWMGKNPEDPPSQGKPLENVASITMDQFTQLIIGDSKQACFILNGDMFP